MDWESPPPGFSYVLFERTEPGKNVRRFYLIGWFPSLFGNAVLRWYGRKGGANRSISTAFASLDAAWPFIRGQIKARLRHGYQVVAPEAYRNDTLWSVDEKAADRPRPQEPLEGP